VVGEVKADLIEFFLDLLDDAVVDRRVVALPVASPAGAVLEELGHLFE
jgi:hypothetical protein